MKILTIFISFIAFCLASLVVLIPIAKENLNQVNAEATVSPLTSASASAEAKATDSASLKTETKTDYYLPYPGILPDHPLYWLKMVRDRLSLAMTQEPVVRFEKLLLYADKRIGAAEALIKGRKFSLGISTANKAEIYLERAIAQFEQLKKEGKATAILEDRISKAVAKHQELLEKLEKESKEEQGNLSQLREKAEKMQQKVWLLIGK